MENWDFMQQNLGTSYGATGTLNEQAEIYAESWEATRDRVQASLETIYEKLLDDEFFIKLLNGLEKTITGVDKLIDSMGGLKGILSVVGVMVTKIFEKQLS
jgi:type VI protein secretion system component VasK